MRINSIISKELNSSCGYFTTRRGLYKQIFSQFLYIYCIRPTFINYFVFCVEYRWVFTASLNNSIFAQVLLIALYHNLIALSSNLPMANSMFWSILIYNFGYILTIYFSSVIFPRRMCYCFTNSYYIHN